MPRSPIKLRYQFEALCMHSLQFYAMVNFCNPGVLGSPSEFRKRFESPILQGREPSSTADEAQLGLDRSAQLSNIVNDFILRRTNALLSAHLPPKVGPYWLCLVEWSQQSALRFWSNLLHNRTFNIFGGKTWPMVIYLLIKFHMECQLWSWIHGRKDLV